MIKVVMQKFFTFQIAFFGVLFFTVILITANFNFLQDIWHFDIISIPVGAIFLIAVAFWSTKAISLLVMGKTLSGLEITLASILMLGMPVIVFIVLFVILSSIGLWMF